MLPPQVLQIKHGLGEGYDVDAEEPSKMTESENQLNKTFLREVDAMIRLRSPHTVHVYGQITSSQHGLVLVMELLVGGDLRMILKSSNQPLPEEQSLQILRDICAGMTFLHSKDTIHGDLKSANVLLDGDGRAKVCLLSCLSTACSPDLRVCSMRPIASRLSVKSMQKRTRRINLYLAHLLAASFVSEPLI